VPRPAIFAAIVLALACAFGVGAAQSATLGHGVPRASRAVVTPLTSHPRLWIRAADLPRLRAWASQSNPIYRDGIVPLVKQATADMDRGLVPGRDGGSATYEQYPTESYTELFAFMSLIDSNAKARAQYAGRARSLLLHVLREADKGVATGQPFRWPAFATSDRSRWDGEGFALTVDWIYPTLSRADKSLIRAVFLRWSDELVHAATTNDNHPEPIGVVNNPVLLRDPIRVRYAGNNYYNAHMRNLGLMAMALDARDDPSGRLRTYLKDATGAWLYTVDNLLRTDARGGLAPEGFEYGPQSLSFAAQFLLALHTAGMDDPALQGRQVVAANNPFWRQVAPAFLSSLSPATASAGYLGQVYQPAWYGDGQQYLAGDYVALFGALGLYDSMTGDRAGWDAARWIQTFTPPGGAAALTDRVRRANFFRDAIFYFLLFDPAAPAPPDPRPAVPLTYFSPGIGHLLARTGWGADAAFLDYSLGWISIDHQTGDGNQFEFYRHGEWLTKTRVGYGLPIGESDYHNTLALQNSTPAHDDAGDYRHDLYLHGSQWVFGNASGDGKILAQSSARGYVYALGDATGLYNSASEGATDILAANRAIVWLQPDTIIVYDRAASRTANRFKRFWLQLPAPAVIRGNRAVARTARGQQLIVTTLLPVNARISSTVDDNLNSEAAAGEPMHDRLLVEAPGGPARVQFLHVLQGADAGAAAERAVLVSTCGGSSYTGAAVGRTIVLFPTVLGAPFRSLSCSLPAGITAYVVTGLAAKSPYTARLSAVESGTRLIVTPGGASRADGGGVLAGLQTGASATAIAARSATPASRQTAVPTGIPTPLAATPNTRSRATSTAARPVATAAQAGEIAYTLSNGDVYTVAARASAAPLDVSRALDRLGKGGDDWLNISANGRWLVLSTRRFAPECASWSCLAIVSGDLSSAVAVRAGGRLVHPEGFGAVSSNGQLIVYSDSGGPHTRDLYAIKRQGNAWSAPILLSGSSRYAFNEQPALSYDGARVIFECGNRPYGDIGTALCAAQAGGGGFKVALDPSKPSGTGSTFALLHEPAFAADGDILFEGDTPVEQIWRLPSGVTTPVKVGARFTNDNSPCGLPNGSIASLWLERAGGAGRHEIKVMSMDGNRYVMALIDRDVADIGIGCGA
jgi:hypothetical protein